MSEDLAAINVRMSSLEYQVILLRKSFRTLQLIVIVGTLIDIVANAGISRAAAYIPKAIAFMVR